MNKEKMGEVRAAIGKNTITIRRDIRLIWSSWEFSIRQFKTSAAIEISRPVAQTIHTNFEASLSQRSR